MFYFQFTFSFWNLQTIFYAMMEYYNNNKKTEDAEKALH